MILLYKNDAKIAITLNFKSSKTIAKKGKAFSDGKFVKHCQMVVA